jgi:hypothetical protein
MLVKLMGNESLSDNDTTKTYQLISKIISIKFSRIVSDHLSYAKLVFEDESSEEFELVGNVYIFTDSGISLSNFGSLGLVKDLDNGSRNESTQTNGNGVSNEDIH